MWPEDFFRSVKWLPQCFGIFFVSQSTGDYGLLISYPFHFHCLMILQVVIFPADFEYVPLEVGMPSLQPVVEDSQRGVGIQT